VTILRHADFILKDVQLRIQVTLKGITLRYNHFKKNTILKLVSLFNVHILHIREKEMKYYVNIFLNIPTSTQTTVFCNSVPYLCLVV